MAGAGGVGAGGAREAGWPWRCDEAPNSGNAGLHASWRIHECAHCTISTYATQFA